ncbi:hypothetical protein IIE18_12260 [Pseudomonas sp. V1]|uniref:hypothetical protein n=1 Tax=Pseudomonas arcuscaelestis TaxID=2710591 RepID=UPI00193EE507|nr:hypothetical protein [Pseudomonas arcuscaelestis]MBM3105911.1 hypothetical protein [Pseudomonas arcuscaelestis]
MNWQDKLRNWDWDVSAVWFWFLDITQFHVERVGWPAYVAIGFVIIAMGLAFQPTRGLTSLIINAFVRSIFSYLQIVLSLVTVQLVIFLSKVLLAQFHRLRRWASQLFEEKNPS